MSPEAQGDTGPGEGGRYGQGKRPTLQLEEVLGENRWKMRALAIFKEGSQKIEWLPSVHYSQLCREHNVGWGDLEALGWGWALRWPL